MLYTLKKAHKSLKYWRVMEAGHSVMDLENIQVVKEVRGTINRKVNLRDSKHRQNS